MPVLFSLTLVLLFACDDNIVSGDEKDDFIGPQLTFGDTLFDFGYTPQNATVSHTFWLYSTGTEPVEIHRVIPG
ncbi:MAG: hypothetical protein PHN52_13630 [candidate division Zixibacteria bacterium]|nr:hypothetical protein [candidate division Zixibacteria bacterium]